MRTESLEMLSRWNHVGMKDVLPLLSGMFSLNDTFMIKDGLRVIDSFDQEIIDAFK